MKVSSVTFSLAVVFILTYLENTNAQGGRFDAGYDATILLQLRSKDIKRTCPNGVDHCICANNVNETTTGPFFYDEDPLGVVHTYLICNPGTCFCKGDPTTPRDTRPDAMKAVLDVCPTGEMNRCLCHDNKKVTFPFDYQTLFLDCRPKRCKCNGDSKVKKVTKMGCKNGGFAFCPRLRTLYCKDGTLLDRPRFFQYLLEGRKGCICKDGIMPRCEDTDDVRKCPDGTDIDWSLGGSQEFRDCKVEAFHVGGVIKS